MSRDAFQNPSSGPVGCPGSLTAIGWVRPEAPITNHPTHKLNKNAFMRTRREPFRGRTIAADHSGAATIRDRTRLDSFEVLTIGNSSPFTIGKRHERGRQVGGWEILPRDCFRNRSEIDDLRRVGAKLFTDGVQTTDQVERDVFVLNEMLNWLVEVSITGR